MSAHTEEARRQLDQVVRELDATFRRLGYSWVAGSEGTASMGPFATGHFVGPAGKVGLIWRLGAGLGGVTYGPIETQTFQAAHEDVMRVVGAENDAWLAFDKTTLCSVARIGHSVIAALAHDIEHYASKVLDQPPARLKKIAEEAQQQFMESLYEGAASNRPMQPTAKRGG